MKRFSPLLRTLMTGCVVVSTLGVVGAARTLAQDPGGLRIAISFPASARAEPVTGRVYVMISKTAEREPREQVGRTGIPFFGRDVEQLRPGQAAVIDAADLGYPVVSLRDIPPGDYFVQGFVNVYSEFRRSDGHVLWMHDDQWEGQQWRRSPGNLYSDVQSVHLDPARGGLVTLSAAKVIPPVVVPADTEFVRRFKIQSPTLTKFWGRPVYLGATVLLPRDYDRQTIRYPVLYVQGHFSLAAPLGFDPAFKPSPQNPYNLSLDWMKDGFPRMIAVTFQHPTPYFDDSYAVNSVNLGPYGDALINELVPEVEKRFRVITEPYARVLSGGSTGGWESLALQILHPDFFGGTWSSCPDPVTFTDVEGINVYEDANAFYKQFEWRRVPTVNSREVNGQIRQTSEERNRFELVSGTRGRSGEQLDVWSAVFGPQGKDGYFEPLFDKRTGTMNRAVAQYWKEHYDLRYYLQQNWSTVGPKIVDKFHVYTGTADTYLLNNSTRQLQEWMKTTTSPHYEGYFLYGDGQPHCWGGPVNTGERLKEMAQFIMSKKPATATTDWW
jgi:hypothetical protein